MKKVFTLAMFCIIFSYFLILSACSSGEKLSRSRKEEKIFLATLEHPNYKSASGKSNKLFINDQTGFYHGRSAVIENQIAAIPADTFFDVLGLFFNGSNISAFHIKFKDIEGFIPQNNKTNYYKDFDKTDEGSNLLHIAKEPATVWQYPLGENPQILKTIPTGFSFFSSTEINAYHGEDFILIETEKGEKGIVHIKQLDELIFDDDDEPDLYLSYLDDTPVYNTHKKKGQEQIHLFKKGEIIPCYGDVESDDESEYMVVSFDDQYGYIKENDKMITMSKLETDAIASSEIPMYSLPDTDNIMGTIPSSGFINLLGEFQIYQGPDKSIESYLYIEYEGKKGFITYRENMLLDCIKNNDTIYANNKNEIIVIKGEEKTTRNDLLKNLNDSDISLKLRSDIIGGKNLLEIGFTYHHSNSGPISFGYRGYLYYDLLPAGDIGDLIFSYFEMMGVQAGPYTTLNSISFSDNSCRLVYLYSETGFPIEIADQIILQYQYNQQKNVFELLECITDDRRNEGGESINSFSTQTPQTLNAIFKGENSQGIELFPDHDFIFGIE